MLKVCVNMYLYTVYVYDMWAIGIKNSRFI